MHADSTVEASAPRWACPCRADGPRWRSAAFSYLSVLCASAVKLFGCDYAAPGNSRLTT
jgi:hypothetical protein